MSHVIGVLDDDVSILRALGRLLGGAGFAVRTFESGEELLNSGLDGIDCLVMDIQLPGLNGFTVQERLAASGWSIPIVFITAFDDAVTRERARHYANAQYLRKPFEAEALLQAIATALARA